MTRLFFALDVPRGIREKLVKVAKSIPGAKPVPIENMHLTLRFVGERDESFVELLTEVIGRPEVKPFELGLSSCGRFPEASHSPARVLWAGIEPCEALQILHRQIDAAVEQLGVPEDEWAYAPHVTLARVKTTSAAQVADFLNLAHDFSSEKWRVESYHLLESTFKDEGPVYRKLKSFQLGL